MRTGWLAAALVCAGCLSSEPSTSDDSDTDMSAADLVGCSGESSSVYTPYASGSSPTGTPAQYPWRGGTGSYPNGDEDFCGYTSMPVVIECSDDKGERDYVDVTDGCLTAI